MNNKANQYEGGQKIYSQIRYSLVFEENVPEQLLPKLRQESSETSNITEKELNLSEENLDFSWLSPSSPIFTMPFDSQEVTDLDELYKLTSKSSKKIKRNLRKVLPKYRYTCDSETGRDIHGPLPKLIKLQKSSDPCEEIVLIAFLLLEIIEIKSKRIAIIHFDQNEPFWFQLLFKVTNIFSGVTVTNNVGNFIKNPGNALLVTNYNYVRGLEFSEVLLILDAHEYHLRKFIPEAMARCVNKLAILVRPKREGYLKSDTVRGLVDYWVESNEIRTPVLKILSLKVCSNDALKKHENCKETHCQTEKSKYTSYKMHKRCKRYRDLSKTIQSLYPNLNFGEKKVLQQAEAI